MSHKRETCRLCGERTRRLFTHAFYNHVDPTPEGMDYVDNVTATMRRARGQAPTEGARAMDETRTTAAQEAGFLAQHDSLADYYRPVAMAAWRARAFVEGDLYSEAIRGAVAMREREARRQGFEMNAMYFPHPANDYEISVGLPPKWIAR